MMNFTFPDNATFSNGVLKNFAGEGRFTDIDVSAPENNLIEIDGISYYYTYLGTTAKNKGGNSIVLKLYESQQIDTTDLQYGEPDLILKIAKNRISRFADNKQKRFELEIETLLQCLQKKFQNVIGVYHSGKCRIKNSQHEYYDQHLFYTMEYASDDLKSYIELNHAELGIDEKISLCLSLSEGIKELYSMGYYHRDIKPDNIFMIDDQWKIGDLGLVAERGKESDIDYLAEFIGPRGWMSPESMNKYLCEGKGFSFKHPCQIDHQSDIFQLGKVFWYIFQYNAPIGSVKESDFLIRNSAVYSIIKTMLSHSKRRRYKHIDEVIKLLKKCEERALRQLVA